MHFDTVRSVKAVNCAAKYCLARSLVALSDSHQHTQLHLRNFDWKYIKPTSIYSNRGDCMVLMRICCYAFNLVCLSLCPVPVWDIGLLLLIPYMEHGQIHHHNANFGRWFTRLLLAKSWPCTILYKALKTTGFFELMLSYVVCVQIYVERYANIYLKFKIRSSIVKTELPPKFH